MFPDSGSVEDPSAAVQSTLMLVGVCTVAVTDVGKDPASAQGLAEVATITAIIPRAKIPSIQRFETMDPTDPSIGYLLRSATY